VITRLYIKNCLSFKEVDLEFNSGLNIFTGPSGAGKSILMSQSLSKKTLSEISNNLIKYLSLRDSSDFKSETLIEFLDRYANKNFKEFKKIKIDFDTKYKEFIDIEKGLTKIKEDEKNLEDLKEFAKFEIAKRSPDSCRQNR
jgi:DNA repair protein RecN (Recombination protein N)